MSTMRVVSGDRVLGTVTTMRDRTALADLEQEIGSFRSTAHVLRAQAHEFANQLHTISGLIQIGELDEVVRYVDALSERRHALDLTAEHAGARPDHRRAAHGQGRHRQRAPGRADDQRGERARAPRGRPTPPTSPPCSATSSTTRSSTRRAARHPPRGCACGSARTQSSVEIVVTDSGPGIPDDLVRTVFEHGVTTKRVDPLEHGVGLALTRLVCRRRGGEIHVEREDGVTSFVARLGVTNLTDPVAAEWFS